MNGVEMMMKALGIDPNEIREQLEQPIKQLLSGVQTIGVRLAAIDSRLVRIETALKIPPLEQTDETPQPLRIVAQ